MSLRIVTDACKLVGNNRATVVVEGSGLEEVQSTAARHMVIAHAGTMGVTRPGVQPHSGAWPVTPDGSADEKAVLAAGPDRRYRAEYPVQGGL